MAKDKSLPLHLKWRPSSFDEMIGNESTVESLRTILAREDGEVRSFLFHGPSGTGKTTLARIIKTTLNVSDRDFYEINAASTRGIDSIREISMGCCYAPLKGKIKAYLIDECFAKGTKIKTQIGFENIETIKNGDFVDGLTGIQKVKNVFKNKIPLDKVVKLSFDDRRQTFCSKDHLFFTEKGWVKAVDLKNNFTFSFNRNMLAYGSCDQHGIQYEERIERWPSVKLQGGYRESIAENSYRSGREWAQNEKEYIDRQKERGQTNLIRVADVEIFKPGNNDESFRSVIGNQEKDQGFVEFYDLEMDGHPSYYANGSLVHNCHKLTNDAQNSVLKLLEDTPKHVRFILCTTDPEKLIKTIRTRCTSFATVGLQRNKIVALLKRVCDGEGVKFSDDILNKIAETSDGSARQALVIMDQVIDLPTDEAAMEAIQKIGVNENTIMELSQALLKPATKWESLCKIIKGLDEEPEKIRYAVLGYMSTVLLNADNPRAAQIIQIFADSWMYIGKSGLVSSCYLVTKI